MMPLLINCFMTSMGLAEMRVASSRTVRNSGTSIICRSLAIRYPPCGATQQARWHETSHHDYMMRSLSIAQYRVVCLLKSIEKFSSEMFDLDYRRDLALKTYLFSAYFLTSDICLDTCGIPCLIRSRSSPVRLVLSAFSNTSDSTARSQQLPSSPHSPPPPFPSP